MPETNRRLTHRELEVLRRLAAGHSPGRIARELVLSRNTVKTHVKGILGMGEAAHANLAFTTHS